MRELFALALDTPPGGVDALLASEVGNDPGLIDEIKQLLSADAAAGFSVDASSRRVGAVATDVGGTRRCRQFAAR